MIAKFSHPYTLGMNKSVSFWSSPTLNTPMSEVKDKLFFIIADPLFFPGQIHRVHFPLCSALISESHPTLVSYPSMWKARTKKAKRAKKAKATKTKLRQSTAPCWTETTELGVVWLPATHIWLSWQWQSKWDLTLLLLWEGVHCLSNSTQSMSFGVRASQIQSLVLSTLSVTSFIAVVVISRAGWGKGV